MTSTLNQLREGVNVLKASWNKRLQIASLIYIAQCLAFLISLISFFSPFTNLDLDFVFFYTFKLSPS
jgi:hypothetical protein